MNKCKRFRDLILTDYIDNEINKETRRQVDSHVQVCRECHEFAQEVERNLIVPFKSLDYEDVPGEVWAAIKERLEQRGGLADKVKNLLGRWMELFSFSRLASVVASFVVLILIGFAVIHHQYTQQAQDKEQGRYLVYLLGTMDVSGEKEDHDLQTPIEKYFL